MARTVYEVFTGEGYSVGENGHATGDEKRPYSFLINDDEGNTISVVVAQDVESQLIEDGNSQKPQQAVIALETYNDGDDFMRQTVEETIRTALGERGICISDSVHRTDCGYNPTPESFVENSVEQYSNIADRNRQETISRVVQSI